MNLVDAALRHHTRRLPVPGSEMACMEELKEP